MHIKKITSAAPQQRHASLRDTLELALLFLDVVSAAFCVIRKESLCGATEEDDHQGHTH